MRKFFILLAVLLAFALPDMAAAAGVNINTAGASELENLPGIGPSKAAAIIEYRNANGPFTSVDQLDNVPGIGPSTLANLRAFATVGDGTEPATTTTTSPPPAGGDTTAPAPTVSSSGAGRININTASASELENLPGIGPSKAAAIVAYRNANGPFASCDILNNVDGIGDATLASLKPSCTTE